MKPEQGGAFPGGTKAYGFLLTKIGHAFMFAL